MKASSCHTSLVVFLTYEFKKVIAIINNRCNPEGHWEKSSFGGGLSYLFMTLCDYSNLWFRRAVKTLCKCIIVWEGYYGRDCHVLT